MMSPVNYHKNEGNFEVVYVESSWLYLGQSAAFPPILAMPLKFVCVLGIANTCTYIGLNCY